MISQTWHGKNSNNKDSWPLKMIAQQQIASKPSQPTLRPFLIVMNGITSEWFLPLRIKDLVDHAGLSLPLVLWSHSGTFWEKERMWLLLSNNWLIALEILITTDAKEDFLLTPSNTSNTPEVLNQVWHIPTPLRMDNASSERTSQ